MLVIWGKGGGTNVLGDLAEQDCPVCEKRVPFQAVLHFSYRHIWYLFSWVSKREYFAICGNCGNGAPIDKFEARKMFPQDGISVVRKYGWLAGVALVALLVGFAVIGETENAARYAKYLAEPVAGDRYYADLSRVDGSSYKDSGRSAYGVMRLEQSDGRTLVFVISKTASTKKSGVRKALLDGYDRENPLVLSAEETHHLYERGIVYEIRREQSGGS